MLNSMSGISPFNFKASKVLGTVVKRTFTWFAFFISFCFLLGLKCTRIAYSVPDADPLLFGLQHSDPYRKLRILPSTFNKQKIKKDLDFNWFVTS